MPMFDVTTDHALEWYLLNDVIDELRDLSTGEVARRCREARIDGRVGDAIVLGKEIAIRKGLLADWPRLERRR